MKKLLILMVLFLAGCGAGSIGLLFGLAGAAADGYILWSRGEATKYYNYETDIVYRATKRAAATLELKWVDDNSNHPGNYKAKAGDKLQIKVLSVEPGITKVCIRINFTGDKPLAEFYYKLIDDQLNTIEFKQGKPTKDKKRRPFRLKINQ